MDTNKLSFTPPRQRKEVLLILVMFIAGISLLGWLFGHLIIASVSNAFIPIAPSTSLLFFILSILSLIIRNNPKSRFTKVTVLSVVLLSALFSFLIFLEFLFKLDIDIENVFLTNPDQFGEVVIGRMSPITALLFGLICISMISKLFPDSKLSNYVGANVSLLIVFIAFVLLLGYLNKIPLLYGGNIIPVALLTAICFLFFGISLLHEYRVNYWTFNLIKNQTQFRLLKTFLPLVVLVVVLQGLLDTHLIVNPQNQTLTTAVIIVLLVSLTIFMIVRASKSLGNKLVEAEKALRERTMFLDKIIESSALSTWISDKYGTVIRTNPACLDFFGAREDEVVGKYNLFKDTVIREKGFIPAIKEVFEKGNYANIIIDYDFAMVDHIQVKDAKHKIINSIFTPILDSKGNVTNVIVQSIDLTEIKTIEETAIKERNKAQQYLDIAGVMLLSLDNSGIVKLINPKGCEIIGYTKEEILGQNWYEKFIPAREADRLRSAKQKALSGDLEEMSYFENYILTKSGEERLVAWRNALLRDENNKIVGTLSSGEDITEQRIAEQELIEAKERAEESENRFRTMAEQSTEGITVANLDGQFIYVNQTFCQMTGYSSDELLQMTVFDLARKREIGAYYNEEIVSGKKQIFILRKKDGTRFHTEITGTNIEINKQKLILGSIRDISDIIRYQNELIKAKTKAEESDRLKTAFLQNMSHEIRTPLNSIMGFASLLPEENNKALIDNYANIIYKNSEQLVHIIDAIVLYSKLQNRQMPLNQKQFDLLELLKEVKHSFNLPKYQQEVKLVILDLPNDTVMIYSDYEKIWQIYTNLISNAFKYTLKGEIAFGIEQGENEWICFVSDNGIGIPEKEIDKIFERFYRASNVNKGQIGGTGLGLSIVSELVQLIGGKIWVESKEGKGSTFFFTIPISQAE